MSVNNIPELPTVLPYVLDETPTREALLSEAAAMGDNFPPLAGSPADLIADADEMLEARSDLVDLQKRGYRVTEGHFTRIQLLRDEIAPRLADQERHKLSSKEQVAVAEAARLELVEIRQRLARIGKAANLPQDLFSLETKKTTRLNVVMMKMETVLQHVKAVRAQMPDRKIVDQLVRRARELIDEHRDARKSGRLMRLEGMEKTVKLERLERLLYEVMVYISAQGLAAYPGDVEREPRYRLDHLYGRRPSRVADPGAGGAEGVPDATDPAADDLSAPVKPATPR